MERTAASWEVLAGAGAKVKLKDAGVVQTTSPSHVIAILNLEFAEVTGGTVNLGISRVNFDPAEYLTTG